MKARFVNHGSIVTMEALDAEAREWCNDRLVNDDGSAPMRCGRWVWPIDHCMAVPIIEGFFEEGGVQQ